MAITKDVLADLIKAALDDGSDVVVEPAQARLDQANKLANAIELYVMGRMVTVVGVTPGNGAAAGTITG